MSTSTSAPATPKYIFRGHASPIHALEFSSTNTYLVSGDIDGWIIVWDIVTKRAVHAWKGHDGGIVGIKFWKLWVITHGRDHRLRVWDIQSQLKAEDRVNVRLPVDTNGEQQQQREPWILHSMTLNALNFCSFAICLEENDGGMVLAAPNGLDTGGVDVFHLPSERRVSQIRSEKEVNTGMVMAVALFRPQCLKEKDDGKGLCLIAGHEDGSIFVFVHESWISGHSAERNKDITGWEKIANYKPHTQPVLSVDMSEQGGCFVSSSADAILTKFRLFCDLEDLDTGEVKVQIETDKQVNTKHAGQQGIKIRSDGKLFVTAGWDSRVRVYEVKNMKELAVLKWHSQGCYAVAFARVLDDAEEENRGLEEMGKAGGTALGVIKKQREIKGLRTHWVAAGGKDGKISLWDIY